MTSCSEDSDMNQLLQLSFKNILILLTHKVIRLSHQRNKWDLDPRDHNESWQLECLLYYWMERKEVWSFCSRHSSYIVPTTFYYLRQIFGVAENFELNLGLEWLNLPCQIIIILKTLVKMMPSLESLMTFLFNLQIL